MLDDLFDDDYISSDEETMEESQELGIDYHTITHDATMVEQPLEDTPVVAKRTSPKLNIGGQTTTPKWLRNKITQHIHRNNDPLLIFRLSK